MAKIEEEYLNACGVKSMAYFRFIDDILIIWSAKERPSSSPHCDTERGAGLSQTDRVAFRNNKTMITEVILLGFQCSEVLGILLFILVFVIYICTLCGNLLIITLVFYSKTLHTPMYFFITQLAISDIMLTSDIAPNVLYMMHSKAWTMSFTSCVFQEYIFAVTECSECLLLTVMSYDRYLAICNPLHYTSVMNTLLCMGLSIISWLLSIFLVMIVTIKMASLNFCGPNIIDHFYCDALPLISLSCSDISTLQIEMLLVSIAVLFLPFFLIIISYSYVITTIIKIPSTIDKQKAFSTCSSHLIVVSLFYVTLICTYGLPTQGQFLSLNKLLSLLYTVGTPLINPMIYSLRNKDIKIAFEKIIMKIKNLYE
ncbi:olfactory receptor 10A7-like [Hyperolius riggenbachi]|uniref:olfactory receptor 10A7-like n=1 Tax=Hyperolius riggenbachi TaxID=752182 RepID=UPI0035A2D1C2